MSQVVQRRLQIILDESGASEAYDRLIKQQGNLTKKIEEGKKAGKDMTDELVKLEKVNARANDLQKVMEGKVAPSITQVRNAVSKLRQELAFMDKEVPGYAEKFKKFKEASETLDMMTKKTTQFRAATQSVFSQIKSIALGVTVGNTITAITQTITGFVNQAIQGAGKLSDEIADIQKATGLTKSEVEALNRELGKINTRTATSELRQIAVSLGQAGEAASAANVQALDLINVALGDEFGGNAREIGNVLSVLRNNLSDIRTSDFAQDVSRIGNALNELGANGLATAPVVTDIANRIAGVGVQFGVSSGEILGTAAAFQELGINVERGSTAYVKLLQKMAGDTETFARVAGVSATEFANLVNTNINEALLLVAKNSAQAAGSNSQFAKVLDDLNAEGAGVSELLSKLAANGDLVRQKIELAGAALKNTDSIMAEFNTKNQTLGAEIDKLGKKMAAAFNSSTLRTATENFVGWLNNVLESGDKANNEFDRTTQELNAVEAQINNMLPRYDELAGRTNLNAEEQNELRNLINQIVGLVPQAASAFDEYGNALDINKEKLNGWIENNKQLLRELEADAVDSLTERIEYILEFLPKAQSEINTSLKSGDEARAKQWLQTLRTVQVEALENADILRNKYGVELPDEIDKGVTAIARALGRIKELPGAIDKPAQGIVELLLPPDTVLGTQTSTTPTATGNRPTRAGKTAAQLEAERRKKELEDLAKELQRIEQELFLNTLDPYEKRLAQIAARYEQLFTKAGNDIALRDKTLRLLLEETRQLNKEFEEAAFKAFEEQARQATQDEQQLEALRKKEEFDRIEEALDKGRRDRFAAEELKFLQAMARLRTDTSREARQQALDAEIAFIKARRNRELNNSKLTANERKIIEAKADQEIREAGQQTQELMLQDTISFLERFVGAYTAISDIISGFEGAQINRIERRFNKEQEMLDRQLQQKLISEQDYYIRSQNLEDRFQREKAKIARREHKRQQIANIASVLLDSAAGAIRLWKEPGFPQNVPLLALLGIQTAASIAKISSSRPPEFATGGILPQGSSHREGGIGLYDNRTGRHVGEIEGGEPIISRRVYRANKSVVDALLQKGYAHDSTPLPAWYTQAPLSINIGRLNGMSTGRRNYFADGGIAPQALQDPAAVSGTTTSQSDIQTQVLMALLNRLSQPIYANVVYGQFEDAEDAINNIRASGMIS